MGSIFGKAMDENLKKNQDFMKEMHKLQLERQIQMQNEMRERMMALQIAKSREFFYWFGTFYIIATVGSIAAFKKTKKPGFIGPILPLSFVFGYQADLAYGNKLHRIKSEAENIMEYEQQILAPPYGLPTFAKIEENRRQTMNDQRLKATHEFFL